MNVLRFKNVTKRFGNKIVLDNVSLKVAEGDFVGIIGQNAAGKTTIAKIASGVLKPSSGEVTVFGHNPFKNFEVKEKIGFASHNPMLYPELTVYENLEFYGRIYKIKNLNKRLLELLKFLEIYDKKEEMVRELSRGFKQRVAIARALINDPDLLILDEITAGLDINMRRKILDYLFTINNMGKTILLISHYESELDRCNKIIEVVGGRIFERSV